MCEGFGHFAPTECADFETGLKAQFGDQSLTCAQAKQGGACSPTSTYFFVARSFCAQTCNVCPKLTTAPTPQPAPTNAPTLPDLTGGIMPACTDGLSSGFMHTVNGIRTTSTHANNAHCADDTAKLTTSLQGSPFSFREHPTCAMVKAYCRRRPEIGAACPRTCGKCGGSSGPSPGPSPGGSSAGSPCAARIATTPCPRGRMTNKLSAECCSWVSDPGDNNYNTHDYDKTRPRGWSTINSILSM